MKKTLSRLFSVENLSYLGRVEEIAAKLKEEEEESVFNNGERNLFRPFP